MKYPMLPEEKKTKDFIDLFGGYNHNIRIQENEFYDMQNLSSDNYPTLSPRKKRGNALLSPKTSGIRGIIYKDCLYSVVSANGTLMLYINKEGRNLNSTTVADDVERQLIMMGSYIVILPDKQYFNTANHNDYGYIEHSFTSSVNSPIVVLPCHLDGRVYEIDGVSDTVPENVWDGFVWLDTSNSPATLKEYTVTNSTWSPISTNYVRVTCPNIGKGFKTGDGVDISGFVCEDTQKMNGSTVIKAVLDDNNIVVTGLLNTVPSKYTMKVKKSKNIIQSAPKFEVYCDGESVVANEFADMKLIVGGKTMNCTANSQPSLSHEKEIASGEDTWLAYGSPTLEVAFDAVNTTDVFVYNIYNEQQGLVEERLQNGVPILFGSNGEYANVVGINAGTVGDDGKVRSIHLQQPITVKAGTVVYPVREFKSDVLYTTIVTTDTYCQVTQGDGACLALENIWNQTEPITLSRTMPTLDYIIESNNRLWGCRYGKDDKGNFVNQIYASALGDFKNWFVFAGTSADSYFATVGTSGKFTGAINYMGYPVFFKDDCIHTVYGAYPAQYQINTTVARGVQDGCSKSLTVANEVLYYKSRDGIMAYTGSLPSCISSKLGKQPYYEAVCCAYNNKLYVSMCYETNVSVLFVYDVVYGTWYKENGIPALQMVSAENDVYYLGDDFQIHSLFASGGESEEDIAWFAESGILGVDRINKKYISKMNVRLYLEQGRTANLYIMYNSDNYWRHIKSVRGKGRLESVVIPIIPVRSDHFRIKISGSGDVKIYSISKTIEEGSDL